MSAEGFSEGLPIRSYPLPEQAAERIMQSGYRNLSSFTCSLFNDSSYQINLPFNFEQFFLKTIRFEITHKILRVSNKIFSHLVIMFQTCLILECSLNIKKLKEINHSVFRCMTNNYF